MSSVHWGRRIAQPREGWFEGTVSGFQLEKKQASKQMKRGLKVAGRRDPAGPGGKTAWPTRIPQAKDRRWTRRTQSIGCVFTLSPTLCCVVIALYHLQSSVKFCSTVNGHVVLEERKTKRSTQWETSERWAVPGLNLNGPWRREIWVKGDSKRTLSELSEIWGRSGTAE